MKGTRTGTDYQPACAGGVGFNRVSNNRRLKTGTAGSGLSIVFAGSSACLSSYIFYRLPQEALPVGF
ncbi:hypothetical protein [Gaoshiqia sp. Z1-71]|uniref:hypothetical protein n=1 Tax=Gaoshiqia hydrogeniformans TaxID=3290090 RepID=UPI003BF82E9B